MAPNQIVILRHAEKPEDQRDPDLSPAGEERAKMLATLIPNVSLTPDFCSRQRPRRTVTDQWKP
jgi:broad specificity phosphatase PhoE